MHRPILRTRAFLGVVKTYAVAAVPLLVAAAGAIMLLEINYRRATQPDAGAKIRLLSFNWDTSTPWPWLIAIVMLVAGALLFRQARPLVSRAWQRASDEAGADSREATR